MQPQTETHHHASLILLAEDDDDTRHMIATLLRREGYEVVDLDDGASLDFFLAAMYSRATERPRLILSDIRMQGMSGLDVAAHVRQHDTDVPIVLFSAYVDAQARREAARLGVVALLPKPLMMEELRSLVLLLAPPRAEDFSFALSDETFALSDADDERASPPD